MKIIVCVSLVPDTTTNIKIKDSGLSIDKTNVSYIINPYDEYAVEEAMRTKEKSGGEVIVVSFGNDKYRDAIKKAFQMGADRGILIKPKNDAYDSYTVALNIAEYIKSHNPDIIFMGKQSIDFDGALIPSLVGEIAQIPSVNIVIKLEIQGDRVKVEREIEGGKEIIETTLPAIIGTQKGINEPRYPNLKNIMAAKSKPIEEIEAYTDDYRLNISCMKLPPSKGKGKIFNRGASDAAELARLLREEAKVI